MSMNKGARVKLLYDLLLSEDDEKRGSGPVKCPASSLLIALAEERLAAEERSAVMEHVSACAACADLYERLAAFALSDARQTVEVEEAWRAAETRIRAGINRSLHPSDSGKKQREAKWALFTSHARWQLAALAACLVAGVSIIAYEALQSPGGVPDRDGEVAQAVSPAPQPAQPTTEQQKAGDPSAMMSSPIDSAQSQPESSMGLNESASKRQESSSGPVTELSGTARDGSITPDSPPNATQSASGEMSFTLASGSRFLVVITSIRAEQNSVLTIRGRLSPVAAAGGSAAFSEAEFSGLATTGSDQARIGIERIQTGNQTYTISPVESISVTFDRPVEQLPQPGQAEAQINSQVVLRGVVR